MVRRMSAIVLVAIALAGCGGGGGDDGNGVATLDASSQSGGTTTTTAKKVDPDEAMRQFARCMREHGVDMPDPQMAPDGKGYVFKSGGPGKADGNQPNEATLNAAQKACEHFMDGARNGGKKLDPAEEAKMRDQALKFAKCMRDHGVDMPDPTFGDGGRVQVRIGGKGVDPESPAFQDAQKACETATGAGPLGGRAASGSSKAGDQ